MSVKTYDYNKTRLQLYDQLTVAEADVQQGDKGITVKRLAALLREKREEANSSKEPNGEEQ